MALILQHKCTSSLLIVVVMLISCPVRCDPFRSEDGTSLVFQVVRKVVIYDGGTSWNCCPGIIRTKNGDLLASFYERTAMFTIRSKDNGLTWLKPERIVTGGIETVIGITALRDGTILWPFYQVMTKLPCCQNRQVTNYVYRSTDGGLTWGNEDPISSPMAQTITYGHIVQVPDGRLLLPVWGPYRAGERFQSGTLESTDDGKTWGTYRQIGYDPTAGCRSDNGFNETSIAEMPDHTLVAILRQQRVGTKGGPCDKYSEPSENFYRAISHDQGKSWSSPERLNIVGTSPALHVLPDGMLLLGSRDAPQNKLDTDHYGLAVRVSRDQGATWTNELQLQDPRGLKYTANLQPGYPDFVDLPNGDIFVIFYSDDWKGGEVSNYIVGNVLHRVR